MWNPTRVNIRPLFYINICDMFFEIYERDIASCADDNKPHISNTEIYTFLSKVKKLYSYSVHMV